MNVTSETRADFLKMLWLQDQEGAQAIRSTVYKVVSRLVLSSFVLSSFLLVQRPIPTRFQAVVDVLIVLLIWGICFQLKHDLFCARQCLKLRQVLILSLGESETRNIFDDASKEKPDIKDHDLWWIPAAGTIVIGLKVLLLISWWR